jgi:subtilisin family serine protease
VDILYSDILKLNRPESQPTQTYREIPSDATRLTAFPAQDQVVGVADFNQDGKRDLLLRNSSTGELQIWYMNAQYKIGEAPILYNASANHIANWVVEGVGDFNGDGSPDIVWRNLGQGGNTVFWLMNNHVLSQEVPASGAAPASIAAGWRIDAIADFNNDGKNDLVWRDYSTNSATSGKSFIWYMNNTSLISGNGGFAEIAPNQPVSLDWKIAGVADFNNDGVKDLFWHNSVTGQTAYWNMNAGYQSIANGYFFWTVASGWSIDTVGDINADNVADLVWKAPDGSHWFWSLNYSSTLNLTNGPLMIADANRLQANITSATGNFNANGFHSDFGYGMVNTSATIAYLKNQLPATEIPDSIAFNLQYNNARQNEILNMPEVWAQGHTGQGITVAVIDSGVAIDHPALSSKIWTNSSEIIDGQDNDGNGYIDDVVGWDFTGGDADPSPDIWAANSHGTQVAGMVSAQLGALSNPSGSQIQGGAYGARIMPLKVTYNFGLNPTTNQFDTLVSETASANAVRYAADKGAKVINLSFGSNSFGVPNGATYLDAAVNYAISKGSVVVISAGNIPFNGFASWTTDNVYPAKLAGIPGVIAVGATNSGSQNYLSGSNQASQSAYFSIGAGSTQRNYVMAPGQNVLTTSRPLNPSDSNKVIAGYNYSYVNGTSFSAPLVAAAIANIRQAVPTATPAQITNAIIQTADSSDIYLWNA